MSPSRIHSKALLLRLGMLVFWCGLILWLSLHPSPPKTPEMFSWDKLHHAAAYALLTFFAGRVFLLFVHSVSRGWLAAMITAFLFGALVELAQGLVTSVRLTDPADLAANFVGAAVVAAAAAGYGAWRGAGPRRGQG